MVLPRWSRGPGGGDSSKTAKPFAQGIEATGERAPARADMVLPCGGRGETPPSTSLHRYRLTVSLMGVAAEYLRASVSSAQRGEGPGSSLVLAGCLTDEKAACDPKRLPRAEPSLGCLERLTRRMAWAGNGMWKGQAPRLGEVGNMVRVPSQRWGRARPSTVQSGLPCLLAVCP